jgi:hypothetical protein
MDVFVRIYGRLVLWGTWTIEQVPEAYRAAVESWVAQQ